MLGSLATYTYDEMRGLKHAAAFLIALIFHLTFWGGYFSSLLEWWWMFLVLAILIFWMMRNWFAQEVHIKAYDEVIRDIVSLLTAAVFLLIFGSGYWAGPRGDWWLFIPWLLIYPLVTKVVQKPNKKK